MNLAWPVIQIFVIFDCTQAVGGAVIRGSGQQRLGSYITLTAYWVLGIPLSCACVFWFEAGIGGLWVGPTFATFFNTACYITLISKIDWEKLIETTAKLRLKATEAKIKKDQPDIQLQ